MIVKEVDFQGLAYKHYHSIEIEWIEAFCFNVLIINILFLILE